MEKRKNNFWKIFIILILIIIIIFIVLTARKMLILDSLNEKIKTYENSKNIYGKIVSNNLNIKSQIVELYEKDDVIKYLVETEKIDGSKIRMIQITYPNERKVFMEDESGKTVKIYNENNNAQITKILNYVGSYTISQKLLNSITASIREEKIDGKEYYIISSLYNSNVIYEDGTQKMEIYIEKETGLPIKKVSIIKGKEYIEIYEYKFDCVTDENMKEPDISEYKIP